MRVKSIVAASSAVALSLVMLAACSTNDTTPTGTTTTNSSSAGTGSSAPADISGTLTILYMSTRQAALDPVVQQFKQEYPNVDVKVDYEGGDFATTLATQLQAGTQGDLFQIWPAGREGTNGMNIVPVAAQGYLADISSQSWTSEIPEAWKSQIQWQGRTYGFLQALSSLGAIYNQTALQSAGLTVPTTWDDTLKFCSDAKAKGLIAYAQGLNDGAQMVFFALSSTTVYGPNPDFDQQMIDGTAKLTDPGWIEAFTKAKQMNDAGCFGDGVVSRTRAQGSELVSSGKALGIFDGSSILSDLQKAAPNSSFQVNLVPVSDSASTNYIVALPSTSIAESAKAKNPAAANAFLEVLNQHRGDIAGAYGGVPVLPTPDFKAPASLSVFTDAVNAGKATPLPSAISGELQDLIGQNLQAVVLGSMTPEDALSAAQTLFEQSN